MRRANAERRRRHAAATSAAMRRSARDRTCPWCERKGALSVHIDAAMGVSLRRCRWKDCGFERGCSFGSAAGPEPRSAEGGA